MIKKEKIKISYSHYSSYKECGHRYLLENILNHHQFIPSIYAYFGDAIHDSLRRGVEHELNQEERINNFKFIFKNKCEEKLKDHIDYESVDTFIEQGIEILKLIPTEQLSKKYIFIGAEYILEENLYEDYYFVGIIDLILKNKKTNKYIIIDWKTSTYEWDIEEKKMDKTLLSQMKFYKYFYSIKNNIPLENIDCKYVVLSRFKEKDNPKSDYGKMQNVEIDSGDGEIKECLEDLAKTTRDIFIKKIFKKAKLQGNKKACYYCPFKENLKLCNNNYSDNYESLLKKINENHASSC